MAEVTTERDLTTIPLRGHQVHVWRQPEPTKHAFAWRVVRDSDFAEHAGQADTDAEAWDAALGLLLSATERRRAPVGKYLDAADAMSEVRNMLRFLWAVGLPADVPQDGEQEGYRYTLRSMIERLSICDEMDVEVSHG